MRVLIVGCGYVGTALGAELARSSYEVSGLRRSWSKTEGLAGIRPLTGDITRPASFERLPSGWDWVVNCVSSSRGTVEAYRAVYLEGTKHLLNWLTAAPPQKFVYTGSTSVYGQTDGSWVDETSATEAQSETARLLLQTEKLLLDSAAPAAGQKPIPAVLLRVSGIYGPGRTFWLDQFPQKNPLPDGPDRFLNMVHLDDVVGAICAALERGTPGEIYNVSDDEPIRRSEFVGWLSEQIGVTRSAAGSNSETETRSQPKRGFTNKRVLNDKLKQTLAYRLRYPTFREGYSREIARRSDAGRDEKKI